MRDKADMLDKTEQLEHLIMQLQGETDTIGEYVTLYQHQRSVLRQRAAEKDDFIARLSRERSDMAVGGPSICECLLFHKLDSHTNVNSAHLIRID